MISLVVCCRNTSLDSSLLKNIEETIGCEYQLVIIDNSAGKYNIFQAYNEGVRRSKYDIICFMHDDLLYHTVGWGNKVIDWFKSPDVGMLGISGNTYMSRIPTVWWASSFKGNQIAVRQNSIDTDRNNRLNSRRTYINPLNETNSEVIVNDGLFFCIRKKLFDDGLFFDEKTFSGFHFYDIDISFQVRSMGYRILCVYDFVIEHISSSVLNKEWLHDARLFYNKWEDILPISILDYDKDTVSELEYSSYKLAKHTLRDNKVGFFSYFKFNELLYIIRHCFRGFIIEKFNI